MSSDAFGIRPMTPDDLPAVVALMSESFQRRSQAYFEAGIARLTEREVPDGYERYGFVIDDDGVKGAILAIPSLHETPAGPQVFVNLSSWCVAKSHRGPAAKALYGRASDRPEAVNTNLSAAAHTLKTVGALGFRPWTVGQLVALGARARAEARVLSLDAAVAAGLPDPQARLLAYHARFGCLTPVIESNGGLMPLIFLRRKVRRLIPAAQLIYCPDRAEFLAQAAAVFAWLRLRGFPALLIDSNGPEPALRGKYYPGVAAKYVRGQAPRLDVDHTYSEMIYLGF
jgi:hypothetical protein